MKKLFFLFMLLCIVSFFNCIINDTTGLLIITNLSNSDVTQIKAGSSTLVAYLSSGAKRDYWYFKTLSGQLSANGVVNKYNVTFKLNHEYKIEIFERDEHNYFKVNEGKEKGTETDDQSNWDDPVD